MVRQPTDPDPYDERRGVSGYTFAFGDEPDLNRQIYFHEHPEFPVRSHIDPIGVFINHAFTDSLHGREEVPALKNAKVDLLGKPMLENRNWTLTAPGYEPIIPFHLEISTPDFLLCRLDALDPDNPEKSYMDMPKEIIQAKGARGLAYEPATVGPATGIYNYYFTAKERRQALMDDLQARRDSEDPDDQSAANVVMIGRIQELSKGIKAYEIKKENRRTAVHPLLERFGYYMSGHEAKYEDPTGILPSPPTLAPSDKWRIDFWMGGWDFDALCCYAKGQLQIPLS